MNTPDLQPFLTGSLLRLAPLAASDFDALFAVASDPLVWEQHPSPDRYKPEVFAKLFEGGMQSGGALLIRDARTDEVIGSSRYYEWNPEAREIAIGYTFLARKCWGGRYNRELKRLMLGHAFGFAERVWFHVGSNNLRSRRAMQKIGGRLSHEVQKDAAWGASDMVYFFVTRECAAELLAGR